MLWPAASEAALELIEGAAALDPQYLQTVVDIHQMPACQPVAATHWTALAGSAAAVSCVT
jgi:hypothetical protein